MPYQQEFDEIKVELTGPGMPRMIANISDEDKILQVRKFINDRQESWKRSDFTTPESQITLAFYDRHKYAGVLFVGADFFAMQNGDIVLHAANDNDLRQLGEILDLELLQLTRH